MADSEARGSVGSSLPIPAIVASVIAVAVIVVGFFSYLTLSGEVGGHEIVIATGPESGTYHALGVAAAKILEAQAVVAEATVISTSGSVANMDLIGGGPDGGADLAFIQGDTVPNSEVRLVMPLYDEVLHILVAKGVADEIQSIYDLRGRPVSLGEVGSGTRPLAERVLKHFRIESGEDIGASPTAAAEALENGTIDAAFFLTAIPSRLISGLAQRDSVRFLSLGDAQEFGNESEGLELVFPSLHKTVIPRSTYVGLPESPVLTIGVSALLVASRGLDPELVHEITSAFLENRPGAGGLEGDELVVAKRIREDYRPGEAIFPYHLGAAAYYEREEPPFFVEYAEALSLGLTLLVGAYSGFLALREWMRRRMKNRIDAYYIEVDNRTVNLDDLSLEGLIDHREALHDLRRRAFSDLVSERLLADQSFTIFQDHLRGEFSAVEARIAEKSRNV